MICCKFFFIEKAYSKIGTVEIVSMQRNDFVSIGISMLTNKIFFIKGKRVKIKVKKMGNLKIIFHICANDYAD